MVPDAFDPNKFHKHMMFTTVGWCRLTPSNPS